MSRFNTPIKLNHLELPNRLVMPPMATAKSNADGTVTEELCDYYNEKSRGNYIGLIIVEHSYISPEGKASEGQLSIADGCDMAGLERLVSVIHKNHTRVMAQLNHAGGKAKTGITGRKVLSASAVRTPRVPLEESLPVEMTLADIEKVIRDFASAAVRAKEAGFDGVEIHSAHGYLLNQFYSPITNKRTDAYGGNSMEGRMKLQLDILDAVRNAVGADYPIALRLGACDYMEGGISIGDSVYAAKEFEKAGLDLLDISGGFCGYVRPGADGPGYFSEITEAIKNNSSIPVILTGGIEDAAEAEKLLAQNKADLIGVGRAILRDSGWAEKAVQSISYPEI